MATYALHREGEMPLCKERTNINMSTGIKRIADKAQNDKDCKFTSLTHHITKDLVLKHLKKMPKSTSSGIDGVERNEALRNIDKWFDEAIKGIHNRGYKAPPVKRVYIPKPGKSVKRPIGIPNVADRAIQGAVSEVLGSIYEQDFLERSYGGRINKSAHMALSYLRETISTKKVSWILEADLKNFFGTLDHQWTLSFLKERIGDPRIINLIQRWLKAGIMEDEKYTQTKLGVPQGGPASVLISNIYLHYVLDLWLEKVVKPRLKGEMYWVRYLDDFVICFQYKSDANRLQEILPKRLSKFKLELESTKTKLVEFGRYARTNSKKHDRPLKTIYFLGFNMYCGLSSNNWFVVNFKTEKSRLQRAFSKLKEIIAKMRHLSLSEQHKRINLFLSGHYRYYGFSTNFESLQKVYSHAYRYWKKSLSRRSQKGRLSWEAYTRILKFHPILKPKIYISFVQIRTLANL